MTFKFAAIEFAITAFALASVAVGACSNQLAADQPQHQLDSDQTSPDDLRTEFLASWTSLRGLHGTRVLTMLESRDADPGRVYHDLRHLWRVHARLNEFFASESHAPSTKAILIVAWWFRCAEFETWLSPISFGDQRASARRFRSFAVGMPIAFRRAIEELILATISHGSEGALAKIMIDADLSIFGESPEAFADSERQLRRQRAWIAERAYRLSRGILLNEYARRKPLY